jgi:hypothetical protein
VVARVGRPRLVSVQIPAPSRLVVALVVVLGGLLVLAALQPHPASDGAPAVATPGSAAGTSRAPGAAARVQGAETPATSGSTSAGGTSLGAAIASLVVADDHRGGYHRALFKLWIDADGNGCNTRKEVLLAEAVVRPAIGARCGITGGRWVSAYDGVTVTDASRLEIDHLVPLAEAWASGAWAWTPARREAYANDLALPATLIAVTSATNQDKGDRDPAAWMPPLASDACTYVADWVAVKLRWGLTVDPAEERALQRRAAGCLSTIVPTLSSSGS